MELNLTDKIAVVTGGSKGIGLATARTLRAEGAHVVVASRKSSAELDALAGPDLVHGPADLTDPAAPAAVVERAVEVFGGLDVLVNNAGGPPPGVSLPRFSFLPLTEADWRDMFEFNLLSAVRTIRAAIPVMLERGGGAIVNVSSNTVSPGPVRTPWWTDEGGAADALAAALGVDRDAVMDQVAPEAMAVKTGRLLDPQEIADMIALLASPRSASTTGADVLVDGGFHKAV